ncbi:MAG: hypothetical protein R3D28_05705 [Geminicoccaceae bacterium]
MGLLKEELLAATGADRELDRRLAAELGAPPAAYTASIDATLDLIRHALPGWGWHLGWHADGIRPYASLHDAARTVHVEAAGPTVPVALLRAMGEALSHVPGTGDPPAGSAPAGDSAR